MKRRAIISGIAAYTIVGFLVGAWVDNHGPLSCYTASDGKEYCFYVNRTILAVLSVPIWPLPAVWTAAHWVMK